MEFGSSFKYWPLSLIAKSKHREKCKQKLNYVLDNQLGFFKRLSIDPTTCFGKHRSTTIEEIQDYIEKLKKEAEMGRFQDYWEFIPEGEEKNILRAKQARIKNCLDNFYKERYYFSW